MRRKNNLVIVLVLSVLQLSVSSRSVAEQDRPQGTVSPVGDPFTNFLEHAEWPDEAAIQAKRVETGLTSSDVTDLHDALTNVLRAGYSAAIQQMRDDTVACADFRNGNDYLLLRYSPNESTDIGVQYGPALYVTVSQKGPPRSGSDMAEFVKTVAVQVLRYPGTLDSAAEHVHVFVSTARLSNSKCGTLTYGNEPLPPRDWYSSIRWWSDGRKVLYEIPRRTVGEDLTTRAGAPPSAALPRRFGFRKKSVLK